MQKYKAEKCYIADVRIVKRRKYKAGKIYIYHSLSKRNDLLVKIAKGKYRSLISGRLIKTPSRKNMPDDLIIKKRDINISILEAIKIFSTKTGDFKKLLNKNRLTIREIHRVYSFYNKCTKIHYENI